MEIKNLTSIPVEEVIACFLTAFENYFVKLPVDINYWRNRFITARVDWQLSFGMFDGEQLVGFIINGIDNHDGKLTAYNTGTGILPKYRGKAIVDQLYAHAIPQLKKRGVEKCLLEVICENQRAIKVYERIGFRTSRELSSFRGTLPENPSGKRLQKCHFSEALELGLYRPQHYSWDNSAEAVKISVNVKTYCYRPEDSPKAYLVIDTAGNIMQLETKNENYMDLLTAAGAIAREVQLKNVNQDRRGLIETLENLHFFNTINQYEMEMYI